MNNQDSVEGQRKQINKTNQTKLKSKIRNTAEMKSNNKITETEREQGVKKA